MARRYPVNQVNNIYTNDDEIDEIRAKVSLLKSLTLDIGEEVRSQNKEFASVDNDFDSVWGKLSNSMSRVKALQSARHGRLYMYLILFSLFVFFIVYVMIRFR